MRGRPGAPPWFVEEFARLAPSLSTALQAGRSLLAFSKGEIQQDTIYLDELLAEVGGTGASVQIGPGAEAVWGDAALIRLALRAMVEQAQAGSTEGALEIRATPAPGKVLLSVGVTGASGRRATAAVGPRPRRSPAHRRATRRQPHRRKRAGRGRLARPRPSGALTPYSGFFVSESRRIQPNSENPPRSGSAAGAAGAGGSAPPDGDRESRGAWVVRAVLFVGRVVVALVVALVQVEGVAVLGGRRPTQGLGRPRSQRRTRGPAAATASAAATGPLPVGAFAFRDRRCSARREAGRTRGRGPGARRSRGRSLAADSRHRALRCVGGRAQVLHDVAARLLVTPQDHDAAPLRVLEQVARRCGSRSRSR